MTNMNVRKLFKLRTQRKFRTDLQNDSWVRDVLKSSNNIEYYITSKAIDDKDTISDINQILRTGFYPSAIFDCGNIFTNREGSVCLFVFDKNKPEKIKLGYHELQSYNSNCNKYQVKVNTNLPKDYSQYIYDIENWVNNNIRPKSFGQNQNYGEMKYKNFLPQTELSPIYYIENLKRSVDLEKHAKLSDYAEIIEPKQLTEFKGMGVKVLSAEIYNDTFDFNDINFAFPTDTQLQKNDILLNYENNLYIHQKVYKSDICVSPNGQVVIRAKNGVNPKALYCILKSDDDLSYSNISPDMPVVEIKEGSNYDEYFDNLTGKKHSYSVDISDANLAQALRSCAYKKMQTVIKNDLNEIDRCYNSDAYKAAVVLCGSVLEAFLYDWLLEKYRGKTEKIDKEWTLQNYIEQIKEIYKPEWVDASEKANKIRLKRNLIHPEQYIKYDAVIDKSLCDKMRNYLKYVIDTRSKL